MKLEEAKKKLDYHKNIIASLDEKSELFEAIKTVLQALETYQNIIHDKDQEIIELNQKCILEKVAKEELEELLENSISKDKVKEKIEELKEYIVSLEKQQNELIALGVDDLAIRDEIAKTEEEIKPFQELLEDKQCLN